MKTERLVILSSGSGSNAERVARHFESNNAIDVVAVYTNNSKAGVIKRAEKLDVPSIVFSNEDFVSEEKVLNQLESDKADYIVLAGFLKKIPDAIVSRYSDRIINIHPSLLPKYGGKGMYGSNVHKAVIEAREKESGITIHLVNEDYDKGEILKQFQVKIEQGETTHSLEEKIKQLEHQHFATTIETYILNQK